MWKKFAIPSAMQRNMHSMPSLVRDGVSDSVLRQIYSLFLRYFCGLAEVSSCVIDA